MSSELPIEGMLSSVELVENLYQLYQTDPAQLDPAWREYFSALEKTKNPAAKETDNASKEWKVARIIDAFRTYGHLATHLNPIALKENEEPDPLKLVNLAVTQEDLDENYPTNGLLPKQTASLQDILNHLRNIYCSTIGFEFKHLHQPELEQFLQENIEQGLPSFSQEDKRFILDILTHSELFESFLHTKYVGQKRFSLEGAESLIPMLTFLVEKGADEKVEEFVLGMAHRGRLNVMSHILHKSYQEAFNEFDENYIHESFEGTGDVKYHKGYAPASIKTFKGKEIKVTLTPNPSHLESIDPVVEGKARALQFIKKDENKREKVIPVLMHGDAALSGQGIVYETLQLAGLPGYTTGGTLHFVVNNQIGFTTIPRDLRSTHYCTDIAYTFGAPVFHVNAEDPESAVAVTLLALAVRQRFHCDVFIDLNGYRKYGHNETDEPAFTQPHEYQLIKNKKTIRQLYRDRLVAEGILDEITAQQMEDKIKKELQDIHLKVTSSEKSHDYMTVPSDQQLFTPFSTAVPLETLQIVAERFSTIPIDFKLHPKVASLIQERLHMMEHKRPLDWGMAEHLAYATLLWEGISVRFAGQDSARGTFSHRHAVWVDQSKEREYFPLAHLKEGQGRFEMINSSLSELAVLGFEYGYSLGYPQGLIIWEAQFGDFGNGAQVIIDQYIASGEQKWGQQSRLVLFLPHGYEGQGPEHSSGRIERFLSLAGHDNFQVVYPTTPAQLFHLLRRQVLRDVIKPLIVFTPKGLLRYPACTSNLDEITKGTFQDIIDDTRDPDQVDTIVFCTGRIYYDLTAEEERRKHIAIIRIEQLYPFNADQFQDILLRYPHIRSFAWVQEEHQNMGAWTFIRPILESLLPENNSLKYIGRNYSASPATGSHVRHKQESAQILNQVFSHET